MVLALLLLSTWPCARGAASPATVTRAEVHARCNTQQVWAAHVSAAAGASGGNDAAGPRSSGSNDAAGGSGSNDAVRFVGSDSNNAVRSFCSLAQAADWVARYQSQLGYSQGVEVCLHSGVHTVAQPVHLNASHSGSRWVACASSSSTSSSSSSLPSMQRDSSEEPAATISGGLPIPPGAWQPASDPSTGSVPGLWVATLPAGAPYLRHARTLFVGGVRANRTVVNASALLGRLQCTAHGYTSEHAVPWSAANAEEVELNYFQQLAPWQAQRCVLTQARYGCTGHLA